MSVSVSSASSAAIAVVNEASTGPRGPEDPGPHPAVERRSGRPGPRPGPRARSSSSAASIDASSRGMPPTRPAEVRPVSSTTTIRRSRSGRQVRTIDVARGAPPTASRWSARRRRCTYSRSESNSVPCPRSSDRCCPSSSRSRASFSRQVPAAAERRQDPDGPRRVAAALPGGQAERAERAHGHQPRSVSPRRSGVSVPVAVAWPPAGAVSAHLARLRVAALGGQAVPDRARSGAGRGLTTVTVTVPVSPSRTRVSPDRLMLQLADARGQDQVGDDRRRAGRR